MRRRTLLAAVCLAVLAGHASADWHPAWMHAFPARKPAWENTARTRKDIAYEPVVFGRLVAVGCEHNGAVVALDLVTGREAWRFYTNGPIRVAPAVHEGRLYVASDDGYLYCLDGDGQPVWTFRGGPSQRKVLAHERFAGAWPCGTEPLVVDGKVLFAAGQWPVDGVFVHALDAASGKPVWTNRTPRYRPHGATTVVGDTFFVYGYGGSGAYDVRSGATLDEKRPRLPPPPDLPTPDGVEGNVVLKRLAGDRLFVATAEGRLYCFADGPTEKAASGAAPAAESASTPNERGTAAAERLLDAAGVREGYALVLGLRDGALVEGLLAASDLHVIAVERDAKTVDAVRRRLDARGCFDGHRLSVCVGDPAAFGLPPFVASLITTETSLELTDALRERLRPYGGTFAVLRGGKVAVERREGGVPGAGEWTHELCDAANSLASRETVVRAPLGVLWYESPAAAARFYFDGHVDHQSGESVSPLPPGALIVDGRMFLQGPGRLGAFDIYTGRLLWETELPEVYGFGGRGGGVGIHSKKHREPWRHEGAMNAEVPATHHPRTTGFNYTSVRDGIYVAAGKELLCIDPRDGSRTSAWPVPLPEAGRDDLCWGMVRVAGDRLVTTAFRPQDLVDAQCGHDGNGGEWSKDRMPMAHLMVLDRSRGDLLWHRKAAWGWLNRGMAVGGGAVFCVDAMAPNTLAKFKEAGRDLPATPPTLYALDLATGKPRWRFEPDILVTNIVYAADRDTLVVPCRNLTLWQDGGWVPQGKKVGRNTPGRMVGLRGKDGEVLWQVDEAPYFEPHMIVGDILIDRYGHPYDVRTGRPHRRTDLLTGSEQPWDFRKGGCNFLVGCPTLVTWRTAFYDLAGQTGSMSLAGMNMGCTPTMLPAGGVLNVPAFGTHHKRSRMTALALVHRPRNALWTDYREPAGRDAVALRRAGFNFGAPGDRVADDGTLWLAVAPRTRRNMTLEPKDPEWFACTAPDADGWIASCGAEGLAQVAIPMVLTSDKRARRDDKAVRRYDVRLYFAEPGPAGPGERVFTVAVEGRAVVKNLDVAKAAGGPGRPLVREIRDVEVTGALDLAFSASRGRPVLCGVAVIGR